MTATVLSVHADTPTAEIAKRLLDRGVSAAPVVDDHGAPIGMVSEGDLINRNEAEHEARRDWWLKLLAEGTELSPDFLASLRAPGRAARDIMTAPAVTVSEDVDVREIARLLTSYRIKRVPVTRDGRIVGIVSRADLLRVLSETDAPLASGRQMGFVSSALTGFEQHFAHLRHPSRTETPETATEPVETDFDVSDFRGLRDDFVHKNDAHKKELQQAALAARRQRVGALIDQHVSDSEWRAVLHQARLAAQHGEKQFMLLRFPNLLCSDGGRAINVAEPGWPATLRGEAAELYLRWQHDLKPRGFCLTASVLEFPDGMPGDIGLFLVWGS